MVLKCYLSLTELTILLRWPVSVAVTEKVKGFPLLLQSCKKSQSNGVLSPVLRCYLDPFLDSQRSECLSLVEQALWGWKPTQLFHGIMDSRPTFRAEWYCILETPTTPCLSFTGFLFFAMPKWQRKSQRQAEAMEVWISLKVPRIKPKLRPSLVCYIP